MAKSYEERKQQVAGIRAAQSQAGRDIGELPPIADSKRRESCKKNLKKFCLTYFKQRFYLGFSADHLKAIAKITLAVLTGGLFALAMPRGSGKTTIMEIACIWALLYGHRKFLVLVGASETAALELLESIKTELECNELLQADFPEALYPVKVLDGIVNRANGQLYQGERTRITWATNEVIMPTIAGSASSGAVIRVAGITGRVRGMKHTLASGESIRPDLVLVDDPQTDESAASLEQNRKRLKILSGAILGLAGPGRKISGFMPCTVIQKDDMADKILDSQKYPAWQGERCKLCYAMPTNKKLWEQYEVIRANSLRETGNIEAATEFYRQNRAAMDEGCLPAWEERFEPGEISAVQNIMNLKFQDEESFDAEYQNEPKSEEDNPDRITETVLTGRLNGLERSVVPLACDRLTMFVDVQKSALFYVVCAWNENFTGAVIEYDTSPKQNMPFYTLNTLRKTIQAKRPGMGLEAQLYAELEELTAAMLQREFKREDGTPLRIERCVIDANWGDSTEIVYQFCRQSEFSALLMPSHGRGIPASGRAINDYRKSAGDRFGHNWYIPRGQGKRALRHLIYDTNYWKSFLTNRLNQPHGETSSLSIYGSRKTNHDVFFSQLKAEYKIRTEARGRVVDEWKCRPNRDNHFFDCLTGNAVAANMIGARIPEAEQSKEPRQRMSLKERAAERMPQTGHVTPVEPAEPAAATDKATGATGRLSLRELMKQKRR